MELTAGPEADVDALVVKLFETSDGPRVQKGLDADLRGRVQDLVEERDLEASRAKVQAFVPLGETWVVAVGAGKADDLDLDATRRVASSALREVRSRNVATLGYVPGGPLDPADEARVVVEGALYGAYEGDAYKEDPADVDVERVHVVTDADVRDAVATGERIGEAVNRVRDLVNEPPSRMTPSILADRAVKLAKETGLDAEVLDEATLEDLGCGGILGVSSGSQQPPRMVVLRHEGDPSSDRWLALVGKGVTFDSGGLSIKSSEGMEDMKTDMAGAATVIGAMGVIAEEDLDVNVMGVAPMAENLPGEEPLKPGDVIEIYDDTTVEVLNTDAEGRLLLADALSWSVDHGATRIVDAATLTGSVMVALGKEIAGVFGDPGTWRDAVLDACGRAGERGWTLPTPDDYEKQLDSDIADTKNVGGRYGGSSIAALFLRKFVGETPWAHLDIAGVARQDEARPWTAPGGTGAGVRTFVQVARDVAEGRVDL